ncbi:3-deoxy-manno-octulosonate cytidylyltransferase family protein [Synechococcus sp. BS55D]|uniref:3-deoxy-manno-octulosonate cytidylyltransferase family protein n=1 Tax=Synechococcus sp. BS55D TaxID=2055943 RepID=UPI00103D1A09|nr:manno-octulosonate cytidylyltransferase [Synechococcus sp. BS55D]TCD58227.1 3-deoxy-manno-octulosonate cytidylyltransferase [Synechococcus sp. BS55D]
MAMARSVVAVPARLASSRLPDKVLADIGGQPMIQRVLEQCAKADGPATVVLCTDSQRLQGLAEAWGFPVLMTSEACSSGSERIASVADQLVALAWDEQPDGWDATTREQRLSSTAVINVQGDQPFLDPAVVTAMVAEFSRRDPVPAVVTPVYRLQPDTIHNPAVVKTLLAHDGRALYFSRSAIPHVRDVDPADWHRHSPYWGHVGMYGFRGDVLAGWDQLPASPLEDLERLEQLRLLEAGHTIATFRVEGTSLSVDTAEQLEEARRMAGGA